MFRTITVALLIVWTTNLSTLQAQSKPQLHVLAVGVDTNTGDKLGYYADDAETIAKLLQNPTSTTHSPGGATIVLRGRAATRDQVLKELTSLQKRAKADDTTVVVFSVHGVEKNHDLSLSLEGAPLTGKELLASVMKIPGQRAILMDTCRAGAILQHMDQNAYPSLALLLATHANEDSSGNEPVNNIRHGFFVNAWREGLLGLADTSPQHIERVITLRELGDYAIPRASSIYPRQQGQIFPTAGLPEWPLVSYNDSDLREAKASVEQLFCNTRNPWCDPDVIGVDGEAARMNAIKMNFPKRKKDDNAQLWPTAPVLSCMPTSLKGDDWAGRWKYDSSKDWNESQTVKLCVKGNTIFIQYDNGIDAYLFEAEYVATDRLAGRYHNVRRTTDDYGVWTGRVVDFDRIDGIFRDGAGSGRWDFRRRVQINR